MEDFGLHFCTRHAILIWQHSRQLVERDVAKYFLFSLISFFLSFFTALIQATVCWCFSPVSFLWEYWVMPAGDAERWIILLRAHGRKRRQPHLTSWHRRPVLQMSPDESTLLEKATEKNLLSEVWCTYRPLGKVSLCNVMHQEFKQRSFWVLCSNEGRIRECISDIKFKKRQS